MRKKLSPVQIRVLQTLKEGGNIRLWYQQKGYPLGWHCQLRNSNNNVLRSSMHILTVELLQSEKKQGMLLKVVSKTKDQIIYTISQKGLHIINELSKPL